MCLANNYIRKWKPNCHLAVDCSAPTWELLMGVALHPLWALGFLVSLCLKGRRIQSSLGILVSSFPYSCKRYPSSPRYPEPIDQTVHMIWLFVGTLTEVHRMLKSICHTHARRQWLSSVTLPTAQVHPHITHLCSCHAAATNGTETLLFALVYKVLLTSPWLGCFVCSKACPIYLQLLVSFSNSRHLRRSSL